MINIHLWKRDAFNVTPKAGRRVGHAEAPKGTLIDEYTTDENGLIEKANIIVDTIHNLNIKGCEKKFSAPLLFSVFL
ncbi:hypothetical protein [Desulfobacter sp. UBA2225]|uniref:hypothetical protein n=1 Tax=Desulfobacter sp. UBA2225 TaxID=1961413 RepID=UPI00258072FA|nr:hypothetical protein [Desulfobacter sp. UBA2225]